MLTTDSTTQITGNSSKNEVKSQSHEVQYFNILNTDFDFSIRPTFYASFSEKNTIFFVPDADPLVDYYSLFRGFVYERTGEITIMFMFQSGKPITLKEEVEEYIHDFFKKKFSDVDFVDFLVK